MSALSNLLPNDAACVGYAKDLPFATFIRHEVPMLRLYLDDFHFRQLIVTPWQNQPSGKREMELVKSRISGRSWFYVAGNVVREYNHIQQGVSRIGYR